MTMLRMLLKFQQNFTHRSMQCSTDAGYVSKETECHTLGSSNYNCCIDHRRERHATIVGPVGKTNRTHNAQFPTAHFLLACMSTTFYNSIMTALRLSFALN